MHFNGYVAMRRFACVCVCVLFTGSVRSCSSAHALAGSFDVARELGPDHVVLVNLSGRGDKDMETAMSWFGLGSGQ